jgi:acyl carrier protein
MTDPLSKAELSSAELVEMPWSERRDFLEEIVVGQFRTALLMGQDEYLSMSTSYFDMGLTSLRLTAIRQHLEHELDVGIDATVLFNRPTLNDLVGYLTELLASPRRIA